MVKLLEEEDEDGYVDEKKSIGFHRI